MPTPSDSGRESVVSYILDLIERGDLRPGDRLPAERDLAVHVGVSRPTVRAGLRTLAAMGLVRSRHGSDTYIPEQPPAVSTGAQGFLGALHGFTREDMCEARRILEVSAAGLAAERAAPEQIAALAGEVASLFASMNAPQVFLVHDISFHRAVAAASQNAIVASLVEMVSAIEYERCRKDAREEYGGDLRDAAEMHRRIYQAIRSRDAAEARQAMSDHLARSSDGRDHEPDRPSACVAEDAALPRAVTRGRRCG